MAFKWHEVGRQRINTYIFLDGESEAPKAQRPKSPDSLGYPAAWGGGCRLRLEAPGVLVFWGVGIRILLYLENSG